MIARLSEEVASRIAAGEVIERPASVLKELIENALDAGASRVDIESRGAGRELLRVSDDGAGMDRRDCRAAFERHATSKISRIEDLESLSTFGFRGEALYSVAAVSKVRLTSCRRSAKAGLCVELQGLRRTAEREAPPVPGTTVEVRELFYNTPARLKFLKSDASEKAQLVRVVEEAALANPGAAFRYRCEGRLQLEFPARLGADAGKARRERVVEALGAELADPLLEVSARREGFTLAGFVSPSEGLPATRAFQFLFINRRPVSSRLLQQALYRAYEPFRAKSRHPVAVLFVEAPARELDVNVHPTKREVRFRKEREVFEAVASAASKALLDSKGIPTLTESASRAPLRPAAHAVREPPAPYRTQEKPSPSEQASLSFEETPAGPRWYRTPLRYLGQVERSYLIFEAGGGLLVMDQHAAQERVLFERYLEGVRSGRPSVQKLMLPISMELPASERVRLLERRRRLKAAGFEMEAFGKTTLLVTAVPDLFDKTSEIQEMIHRALDHFVAPAAVKADSKYDAAALIACKAAVKAHDLLAEREALALVESLRACREGTRCPHGRPTLLDLSRDELARRFGRPGPPPL